MRRSCNAAGTAETGPETGSPGSLYLLRFFLPVHALIRLMHIFVQRPAAGGIGKDKAGADAGYFGQALRLSKGRKSRLDAVQQEGYGFPVHVRNQHQKLIAAIAHWYGILRKILLDGGSHTADGPVAFSMSIVIVNVLQPVHIKKQDQQLPAAARHLPVERKGKLMVAEAVIEPGQAVLHGYAGEHMVDVGQALCGEVGAQRHGQGADDDGNPFDAHQIQTIAHAEEARGVLHEMQGREEIIRAASFEGQRGQLVPDSLSRENGFRALLPHADQLQRVRVPLHAEAVCYISQLPGMIAEGEHPILVKQSAVEDQINSVAVEHTDTVNERPADLLDRLAGGQLVLHGAHFVVEIRAARGIADIICHFLHGLRRGSGALRALAQHEPGGRVDDLRHGLPVPDPAQDIHAGIAHCPALLVNGCDRRRKGRGEIRIVKAGDEKVIRYAKSRRPRGMADAHGDVVVGADDRLRQTPVVAGEQGVEGVDAAFDDEALGKDAILPAGKPVPGAVVKQAPCTRLILVVVGRAEGEPEIAQPVVSVEMLYDGCARAVVVYAHIVEAGDVVGHGDHGLPGRGSGADDILNAHGAVFVGLRVKDAVDIQEDRVKIAIVREPVDIVLAVVVLRIEAGIGIAAKNMEIERFPRFLQCAIQAGGAFIAELAHAVIQDIENLFHESISRFVMCFILSDLTVHKVCSASAALPDANLSRKSFKPPYRIIVLLLPR